MDLKEYDSKVVRRVMLPAISCMTVREERKCLNEIRTLGPDISPHHILSNNWRAGDFALKYITSHNAKRAQKQQSMMKEEGK